MPSPIGIGYHSTLVFRSANRSRDPKPFGAGFSWLFWFWYCFHDFENCLALALRPADVLKATIFINPVFSPRREPPKFRRSTERLVRYNVIMLLTPYLTPLVGSSNRRHENTEVPKRQ